MGRSLACGPKQGARHPFRAQEAAAGCGAAVRYGGGAECAQPAGSSDLVTLCSPVTGAFVPLVGCFDIDNSINTKCLAKGFPNVLRLTYRDADGTGTTGNVAAQLVKIRIADGGAFQSPASVLNSNNNASTVGTSIATSIAWMGPTQKSPSWRCWRVHPRHRWAARGGAVGT